MKQPNTSTRRGYAEDAFNIPTSVTIPGTRRTVKLYGVHPYTLECLTKLWLERDEALADTGAETLRDMCKDPYFAVREALLFVLNDYWKIRLLYPVMWRIWAKLRGYTDEQMLPIIMAGKKKLPLMAHWRVMAFSVDMRTDWMTMTKREAEQYRAELLSAEELLSLKNSLSTETHGGSSSAS